MARKTNFSHAKKNFIRYPKARVHVSCVIKDEEGDIVGIKGMKLGSSAPRDQVWTAEEIYEKSGQSPNFSQTHSFWARDKENNESEVYCKRKNGKICLVAPSIAHEDGRDILKDIQVCDSEI
ncbi:MAG: hypothetical protein WAO91_06310 [Candidatus Nitrosotenuis sp.]